MMNEENDDSKLTEEVEKSGSKLLNPDNEMTDYLRICNLNEDSLSHNLFVDKFVSDSFFRSIFNHTPAGIAITNHNTHEILMVNKAFCDLLGYTEEEFLKLKISDLSDYEIYEAENKVITELESQGTNTLRYIKPYKHKSGRYVWCDLTGAKLKLPESETEFAIGIALDISQQIAAEKEKEQSAAKLAESQERYKLLVENIPDATWIMDRHHKTYFVSPNIINITGFSQDDIIKNSQEIWFERIHPDDKSRALKAYDDLFNHEHPYNEEYRWFHPKGDYIWISDRSINFTSFAGEKAAVGIYSDITVRKNLENEKAKAQKLLEELNVDKDKFFNIVAHDIKSPLTGIMMMLREIADNFDTIPMPEIKDYTVALKDATFELYSLLENLLQWSMSRTNRLVVKTTNFKLGQAVESAIKLVSENSYRKHISIHNNINGDVNLDCDLEMIKTIIRNLLNNAVKFTPFNGKVDLNAKKLNNHIEISVTDTGIGMDEKKLRTLFKLSESKINIGTDGERGTGLGLILSKEFAQLNGGDIKVESTPGVGSTFTLMLPVSD